MWCSKCEKEKVEEEFFKNKNGLPLRHCKECRAEMACLRHKKQVMNKFRSGRHEAMVCISCGKEKEPEEFPLRNKHQRKTTCRMCDEERIELHRAKRMQGKRDGKVETLANILKDTVKAYGDRDAKSLKLCIERAKAEIKNVHLYKEG